MFERALPKGMRKREPSIQPWIECGLEEWRVRRVLEFLCEAFDWKKSAGLQLRPDDRLWQIYRYYYPSRRHPDELEIQILDRLLHDEFGGAEDRIDWSKDLTLADLVRWSEVSPRGPTTR